MKRALLVFVDGLGVGRPDTRTNPIHSGVCPSLVNLLKHHSRPMDVTMGVDGIPQSATGQTAMLTGENAALTIGRHVEAFPGNRLKNIIREHNIFKKLKSNGLTSTFANAYFMRNMSELRKSRMHSVTTVSTLSAFGTVRGKQTLLANESVYQDITRETLRQRGYSGPLVTPEDAATHLVKLADHHRFTLFEYFQTDHAGHRCDMDSAKRILNVLDRFVGRAAKLCRKKRILFLLTSDHGNIEDLTVKGHTRNPVPFIAVGQGAASLRRSVETITDVTPQIINYLTNPV